MKTIIMGVFTFGAMLVAPGLLRGDSGAPAAGTRAPAGVSAETYDSAGRLRLPEHYREWIYLSSGLDMSYNPLMPMGHSMFDNVFVSPSAYQEFLRTGTWPDGTLLVMEVRGASTKGSINRTGKFQTAELMGREAHIKDSTRFAGGWGFFVFDADKPAELLPHNADCYACHEQHGAVQTTFVQFYPTLLDVAKAKGTLAPDR